MYPLSCSYRWHINGRCTWHYWRKMCEIDVKNVWKISHIISHEKQVKNMWNLHVKNMWTCEVLFTWWKHVKYMWNNERAKCETFMWKPCELIRIVSHGTNMWNTSCKICTKHVKNMWNYQTHVKLSCENHVNWWEYIYTACPNIYNRYYQVLSTFPYFLLPAIYIQCLFWYILM